MEDNNKNPVLSFNPNTVEFIRKMYNLDKPGALDEAIDILDAWIKQQAHFVKKDFSRGYLERTIVLKSKGSIERAKYYMDRMCTSRTLFPHLFSDRNPKELASGIKCSLMPRLTKDHYRIDVVQHTSENLTSQTYIDYFTRLFYVLEYLSIHDYGQGGIGIHDTRQVNMVEFLKHIDWVQFANFAKIFFNSYGVRMKMIHLISTSKLINVVVETCSQFVPEKYAKRFKIHKDLESLYEEVDRELLPKDYGGKEPTLEELNNKWLEVLSSEDFREYIREMNTAKTDEALRQNPQVYNEYLGVAGSFRNLKVD